MVLSYLGTFLFHYVGMNLVVSLGWILWNMSYLTILPSHEMMVAWLGSFGEMIWQICRNGVFVPALLLGLWYYLRRKKQKPQAAKVLGVLLLLFALIFTGLMFASEGEINGTLVSYMTFLLLPFFPMMVLSLTGGQGQFILAALGLLLLGFLLSLFFSKGKKRLRQALLMLAALTVLGLGDYALYRKRPSERYKGHGFEYMNGWSSTDFSDYMVYTDSSRSKLVTLPEEAKLRLTERLPVMDGAEACYPLYAAAAKAVYGGIEELERKPFGEYDKAAYYNGRIVTFTNSVQGFNRLVYGEVDLFFGARPSKDQLEYAASEGIELVVTPIGREGFVFFVEEDNPVQDLSAAKLRAVYHGDITNWSELGGNNETILAFQRPRNSGSQTMMEYFMGELTLKEPKTYETIDAMMGVIRNVAQYNNEAGALGYTFRYFLEGLSQEKGVRMLAVDGVYPSVENIQNGSYPLTTSLCLITRKEDSNPNVQKMIDFMLSDQGQYLVEQTGYAPVKIK